jgi:hypothetical protein
VSRWLVMRLPSRVNKDNGEIIFAEKNFYDNNQDTAYGIVIISGTLSGDTGAACVPPPIMSY